MGEIHLWTLQVFRHWNRLAMVFLFLPRIAPLQQSLGPWPQGRGAWLEVMHGMETLETGGLHGFFNRMRSCHISDLRSTSFANHWTGQSAGKDTDESDFFLVCGIELRNFCTPLSTLLNAEHSSRLWCCPHVLMQARNANQWVQSPTSCTFSRSDSNSSHWFLFKLAPSTLTYSIQIIRWLHQAALALSKWNFSSLVSHSPYSSSCNSWRKNWTKNLERVDSSSISNSNLYPFHPIPGSQYTIIYHPSVSTWKILPYPKPIGLLKSFKSFS